MNNYNLKKVVGIDFIFDLMCMHVKWKGNKPGRLKLKEILKLVSTFCLIISYLSRYIAKFSKPMLCQRLFLKDDPKM